MCRPALRIMQEAMALQDRPRPVDLTLKAAYESGRAAAFFDRPTAQEPDETPIRALPPDGDWHH